MENYLAVVKVRGAKMACKASFSVTGVAAAIQKMCEILQAPISTIEEYDLMEILPNTTMRIVASRTAKSELKPLTLEPKQEPINTRFTENTYLNYLIEKA